MSESKSAGMFSGRDSQGLVLVVDDEPDVRKVVRMTLEKAGYEVKMPGNEYISPNPSTGCRREFLSNPATIDLFKNRSRGWSGTIFPQ